MSFTVSWETLEGSESERAYPTLERAMRVWRAIAGGDKVKWSDVHAEETGELLAWHYGRELRGLSPLGEEPMQEPEEDIETKIGRLNYEAVMIEHQDRMSDADHKRLRELKDEIGRLRSLQKT